MIYYGKQNLNNLDIANVIKSLKAEKITQGEKPLEFENKLKTKFKSKYAISLSSGTAALHCIGLSLNWTEEDIILTSPITFIASASCALMTNSKIDFVDIDKDIFSMDPNALEDKIKLYRKKNKKITAVVITDFAGQPADWLDFYYLKKKYDIQLINDNCHSYGATYKDDIGYASKYADAVSLSFHPVKHITTIEGGAILTNNYQIYKNSKLFRSHGIDRNVQLTKRYPWKYNVKTLGYNYRMNDIQAALGISQLNRLDEFIVKKKKIAKIYDNFLNDFEFIKKPILKTNRTHSYHLYVLKINFDRLKYSKSKLFKFFKLSGITLQVHYIPLFYHQIFKKIKIDKEKFVNSVQYYKECFSVPIFSGIKKKEISKVKETLFNLKKKIYEK